MKDYHFTHDSNMVFSATLAGVPGSYQQLLKAKHWITWSWMKDIDFTHQQGIYVNIYCMYIYNILCCIWIWVPLKMPAPPQRESEHCRFWEANGISGAQKLEIYPCVGQKSSNQKPAQSLSGGFLDSQFPSDCCITLRWSGIITFPCHTTFTLWGSVCTSGMEMGSVARILPWPKAKLFQGASSWWLCDWKA